MSLIVKESDFTPYGFTIMQANADRVDYEVILNYLRDKEVQIEEYVYELSGKGVFHVHGVLHLPKNFNKNLLRLRKTKIYIEELYNRLGWIQYITKSNYDSDTEQPLIKDLRKSLFK